VCWFFPFNIFPKLNTVLFVVNIKLTLVSSFQVSIQHRTVYRTAVMKTVTKHVNLYNYFRCMNVNCQILYRVIHV